MKYDELKDKLKILIKEELDYINNVSIISSERNLNELEKLTIYRKLNYLFLYYNNLVYDKKLIFLVLLIVFRYLN